MIRGREISCCIDRITHKGFKKQTRLGISRVAGLVSHEKQNHDDAVDVLPRAGSRNRGIRDYVGHAIYRISLP